MNLIDTHCHLDLEDFDNDRDNVIKRADQAGVKKIINIGCMTVGLHPGDLHKEYDQILAELEKIEELVKNPKVVAIGEIGLEYRGLENDENSKQKQKEIFLRQISMAERLKKPVIIHCRNAYEDLIKILSGYKNEGGILSGVVHCFSGRLSQAKKILDMGFYLSFTGIITYAPDYGNVIKETPLEKILLETDAPYLAPVPYRGQRNEPAYVKEIAKKIAEIKEISLGKVAEQTTQNAKSLFEI